MNDIQNNELDNEINNFNDEDEYPSRVTSVFVLIISLILIGMDLFSLYFSYNYLKESSRSVSDIVFEQCIKYDIINEMFFTIFATLIGISACLLSIIFILNLDLSTTKVIHGYIYFNYFIFGPFLLGASVLGFLNFTKVGFSCERNNPNYKNINISTIFFLLIIFVLGSLVVSGYSTYDIYIYFIESINFRRDGNILIGKLFWTFGRRNEDNNNRNELHERNE